MAHDSHSEAHEHHALPVPLLVGCWGGLMLLTGITVWTAQNLDLGQFNLVLAMVIATAKATLVLTIFMHLAFEKGFNFMIFAISVMAVILFVTILFIDVQQYQPGIQQKLSDITQASANAEAAAAATSEPSSADASSGAEDHDDEAPEDHGEKAAEGDAESDHH